MLLSLMLPGGTCVPRLRPPHPTEMGLGSTVANRRAIRSSACGQTPVCPHQAARPRVVQLTGVSPPPAPGPLADLCKQRLGPLLLGARSPVVDPAQWGGSLRVHAGIHSFLDAFIHSCVHSFVHACIHPFIMHSFVHVCVHSFMGVFIHSCMHSFVHACILSFMCAFICSCMYSSIHACMHSFIRFCVH